jgi:hypothetical protein
MHDLLSQERFESLTLDAYRKDFEFNFWHTGSPGFWKLERGQYFQEPGNVSWEAFAHGDWVTSLKLIESGVPELRQYYSRIAESGFSTRRVRVVEEPITEYLQWELHMLRARDAHGGSVRVVGPKVVAEWETADPLPEIYTLGGEVMYEAVYDETGTLYSARKFTNHELILRCQKLIADIYTRGEPLQSYFDRCVANLPAPQGDPKAQPLV